jgi:hypothetical protein
MALNTRASANSTYSNTEKKINWINRSHSSNKRERDHIIMGFNMTFLRESSGMVLWFASLLEYSAFLHDKYLQDMTL